jgi:nitrite reductase/ring-hydroxylating ferredoxin subunit
MLASMASWVKERSGRTVGVHEEVARMAGYMKVAEAGDLAPGEAKKVEVAGKTIALFNIDGGYHAIDDTCPHRGGPLSEGFIEGDVVTCPWHGAKFRVSSGEVLGPPARTGVSSYRVRVNGSDIEIEV